MIKYAPFAFLFGLVPALAPAVTPKVAVHVSENTAAHWSNLYWKSFHPNRFLEEAFVSDGTPFVELSDAQITSGALLVNGAPAFPILFSLATESISDAEAAQILNYVQAGGTVYAGSSAWTRYQDGTARLDGGGHPTFALAPQLGLTAVGWKVIDSVRAQDIGPFNDHLVSGTTYPWHTAFSYDELSLATNHRVYAALPAASPPNQQYLTALESVGFLPSFNAAPPIPDGSWNNAQFQIRFGDVNGDGRADLIYRLSNTIYVQLANGRGFNAAGPWTVWSTAYDFQIADVNGDGKADIIGRSGSDIQVGLSTGITFASSTAWVAWNTSYDYQLADVNGDGKADIVGRSSSLNQTQVGLSTGSSFAAPTSWAPYDVGTEVQFADFDGDHRADLLFRSGSTVYARLSTGSSFAAANGRTVWSTAYDTHFADVNGDGRADIIGRSGADIQVGLSTGLTFGSSTAWTGWSPAYDHRFADVDGDGKADLIGCLCSTQVPATSPGDLQVAISTGLNPALGQPNYVGLSRKQYGAGYFIYNDEVAPLAGYGGFANDNSEYKTVRTAVVQAFQQNALPLVTLAPWPFPYTAGMIHRHDHWLASDVQQFEIGFATVGERFGEYYVLPDPILLGAAVCGPNGNQINDYNAQVSAAIANGAMIGAHTAGHWPTDWSGYADAMARLQNTISTIQMQTNNAMSSVFVAPAYYAIKQSSLLAIRDAGFLTTGEQGVGPFPHFSIDPEAATGYIGSVLQLPTSEWPGYDNIERMVVNPPTINQAAKLAFDLGGLINVYDHVAGDPYGYGDPSVNPCNISRLSLAQGLLNYVQSLDNATSPKIWRTNSLSVRNWDLQRNRHQIVPTVTRTSSTRIDVTVAAQPPMAATTYPESATTLRITLDSISQAQASSHVYVTLDGVSVGRTHTCADTKFVRCNGAELYVDIGAAQSVTVQLVP